MKKIAEFQKEKSLVPDGVLGPKTLTKLSEILGVVSPEKFAHFMGQCDHESGSFNADTENLNYGAPGLMTIFKKYFPTSALANMYARQPEKIANKVYANRMGNGSEASGEGWKFRGRGAIQLTGKANYQAFSDFIKDPSIMETPELVATKYYFESAIFFFTRNKLWSLCGTVDEASITAVTKRVNGGTNGLQDRIIKTKNYYSILKNKK